MKYHVLITNPDGETVRYDLTNAEHWPLSYENLMVYLWFEGNYCCDCNRDLCFQYANGATPQTADWSRVCGHTYHAKLCREDGTVVFED